MIATRFDRCIDHGKSVMILAKLENGTLLPNKKLNPSIASVTLCASAQTAPATLAF